MEPRDSQDSWDHSGEPQDFLAFPRCLRESNLVLQRTEAGRIGECLEKF